MPIDRDNRNERETRVQEIMAKAHALHERAADARRQADDAIEVSRRLVDASAPPDPPER